MIRTLEMSSRRGTLGSRLLRDALYELFEEISGVSGAGTRFGMILYAPGSKFAARDALDRTVVEVAVGQLDAVCERVFGDGEAMVLAGYLDMPRVEVPDGMVRAVVSEGHLVCLAAEGEPEKLVAEADAERRNLPEQGTQGVDRVAERCRVARAVGEKHTVRLGGEYLFWGGEAGHREDGGSAASELLVDRTLYPVIQGHDAATFFCEGRKQGWLCELRAGGGEVEADHGRMGIGSLAQDVTVSL